MPESRLSSDQFLKNVQSPEDVRKLLQSPYDRLLQLLLLVRKPQWIPDPGPELRRALDAVIVYKLADVISAKARRDAVKRLAARQLMRFVGR